MKAQQHLAFDQAALVQHPSWTLALALELEVVTALALVPAVVLEQALELGLA